MCMALAALFSIIVALGMAYKMMIKREPLDVMKLFKPLVISIILSWWYPPADTGLNGQRKQLVRIGFPILYPQRHRLLYA